MSRAAERIIGLDLVRAAAIIMVLLAHMAILPAIPKSISLRIGECGLVGVETFFALSGFLVGGILYRSYTRRSLSLVRFWRLRWLRTVPAYLVYLLLNAIYVGRYKAISWSEIWPFLLYVQNLCWPHPYFFPEAWSLAVEEWFYLLAPLLLIGSSWCLPARRGFMSMACILMVLPLVARCVFVAFADPSWDEGVRKVALFRLDAIGVGVLIACFNEEGAFENRAIRQTLAILGLALVIFCVGFVWSSSPSHSFFARTGLLFVCPLGAALMLPLFARITTLPGRFVPAAIRWIATISYSAYLCNMLVRSVVMNSRFQWIPPAWQVVLYLVGTLTVATLSYMIVERPFMQLAKRLDSSSQSPSASVLTVRP
jgi:peptidoglycan/LPS O-acetylase OafA/YrhL